MKSRLLLDVVVAEGTPVLELLSSKDQTLLVGGDALLVLNLRLHVVDSVGRFHVEGDGLAGKGLNKNLWTKTWKGMNTVTNFVLERNRSID